MKKYIYIVITVLFLVSCETDIPFDVDKNPPKLVINSLFDANKETNSVILALTGREKATYVKDATVDIYVNGILKDHLTEPEKSSDSDVDTENVRYKTATRFAPNDVIKIEVRTNDGKYHAWSEIIVPQPIVIEKIDTMVLDNSNLQWNNIAKFLRVKTTFSDNDKKRNYYRIVMFSKFEIEKEDPVTHEKTISHQVISQPLIIKEDVVLTDGHPSIENDDDNGLLQPVRNIYGVFDNSRIDGTYTMITTLRIPYWIIRDDWEHITRIGVVVRLRLLSITQMQYLYLKALNLYYNDTYYGNSDSQYDEYMTLPIKFPSNIEGGTGIFGVSIGDEKIIPMEDYIPLRTKN